MTQICQNGSQNDNFLSSKALHQAGKTNTSGLDKNYIHSDIQKFQKRCDRNYGTQKVSPREIMAQICPNGCQNDIFFSSKALHQAGKTNTPGLDKNYVLSGFQKF